MLAGNDLRDSDADRLRENMRAACTCSTKGGSMMKMYDQIEPKTAKEIEDCQTPQGIRRRINQLAYSYGNPLIRAIFQQAWASGLSGEDMYTVLAFEALKRMEKLEELQIDFLNRHPNPGMLLDPEKRS